MTISVSAGVEAKIKERAAAAGMEPTRFLAQLVESTFIDNVDNSKTALHERMLKAAEKLVPDDSWYEEDFTKLRRPER